MLGLTNRWLKATGADLYIILGTSHCGGKTPYILTLKDFATPLGSVETDKRVCQSFAVAVRR